MLRRWMLAAIAVAAPLQAQIVRGTVADRAAQPLRGVVVTLLDSTAQITARALSNERGEFQLTAPREGDYRLRSLRIGYAPASSALFHVAAAGTAEQHLVLTNVAVTLDTVRVAEKGNCQITGDSATATFAVWEQARAALTATQLTTADHGLLANTISYQRLVDPDLRQVWQQRTQVRSDSVTETWEELPPETLHQGGYVVTEDGGLTAYHAPGLETLLSPMFVEDHCFHLQRPSAGADAARIGLSFEPVPERARVTEIEGTLWLDRNTLSLERLEYRYVHLPKLQADHSGGGIQFAKLRNGSWVISDWSIRMPVLEAAATADLPSSRLSGDVPMKVTAVKVTGGELVSASTDSALLWEHPVVRLTGMIIDSVGDRAIAGAQISFDGTSATAVTQADGRFTIDSMEPGPYTLFVRTAALDSLGVTTHVSITIVDSALMFVVRLPNARRVLARGGTLTGQVLQDSSHTPIIAAEITVPSLGLSTRTDAEGRFRLEHVAPGDQQVVVRRIGFGPAEASVKFAANRAVDRTIYLSPMVALNPVDITAKGSGVPTFDEHRQIGLGHFMTRAQLAPYMYMPVRQALSQITGLRMVRTHIPGYGPANVAVNTRTGCQALVYLDHGLVGRGAKLPFDLDRVAAGELEAIEYYAGPGQLPLEYSGVNAQCGVLVLWTRRTP
jgi:hypothetical protein